MLAYWIADNVGEFVVELPAQFANFENYALIVSDIEIEQVVSNLGVGEVWVLCGNLYMGIRVFEMDGGQEAIVGVDES
jgi:hypothetical protein